MANLDTASSTTSGPCPHNKSGTTASPDFREHVWGECCLVVGDAVNSDKEIYRKILLLYSRGGKKQAASSRGVLIIYKTT
jgi:hypothetical protein